MGRVRDVEAVPIEFLSQLVPVFDRELTPEETFQDLRASRFQFETSLIRAECNEPLVVRRIRQRIRRGEAWAIEDLLELYPLCEREAWARKADRAWRRVVADARGRRGRPPGPTEETRVFAPALKSYMDTFVEGYESPAELLRELSLHGRGYKRLEELYRHESRFGIAHLPLLVRHEGQGRRMSVTEAAREFGLDPRQLRPPLTDSSSIGWIPQWCEVVTTARSPELQKLWSPREVILRVDDGRVLTGAY